MFPKGVEKDVDMARDVKKDGSGGEGERKRAAEEEDVKEIKDDSFFKKWSCGQKDGDGWEEK